MLERATHLPSVLLLLAFVLALDISMCYGVGSSILSMSWGLIQQQITIGHALIFFVAFGIYMAVGVVLMRFVADIVVIKIVVPLWQKLSPEADQLRSPYAYSVRLGTLLKVAHMEQNKFYFERYSEKRKSLDELQELLSRISSHAFACLILMSVDSLILPGYGYPSVSQELAAHSQDTWSVASSTLALGLVTLWLFPRLRDDKHDEWVYCPPLFWQLDAEKAKAREEGRLPVFN